MCILAPNHGIMGVVSGKTKLGNRKMFFRHRQTATWYSYNSLAGLFTALVRAILLVWGPKLRLGPLAWFLRRSRVIRPHRNRHPASSYGKGAQRRNRRGKKNPGATAARGTPIGAAVAFRISSRRAKGDVRKSGPDAHATNSQANALRPVRAGRHRAEISPCPCHSPEPPDGRAGP